MNKVIATFLATIVFFQGIFIYVDVSHEINEVSKDYKLHKVKYGDNLKTFISKHYGFLKENHKVQHQRDTKHSKQPINCDFGASQHIYVLQPTNFNILELIKIITRNDNFYYKNLFSTFEKQKIFQPPRLS